MESNPYESPQTIGSQLRKKRDTLSGIEYASPRGLGTFAVAMLAIATLIDGLSVASKWMQIGLLERGRHGGIPEAEALANDAREQLLAVAQLVLFVFCIVAFLMWVYRANRNLRPLKIQGIEFTPGWSVGWWFVPIANLVRPYQILKEIYLGSDPRVAQPRGIQRRGAPLVIRGWWACWLIGNVISWMSTRSAIPTTIDGLISLSYSLAIASFLHMIAGVLAILLVLQVNRRQEDRYDRIADGTLVIAESTPIIAVPDFGT